MNESGQKPRAETAQDSSASWWQNERDTTVVYESDSILANMEADCLRRDVLDGRRRTR